MRGALVLLVVAACGDNHADDRCATGTLDARYVLAAPGITAEVTTRPFGFAVYDSSANLVLASASGRDGYAAATWTSGATSWRTVGSPGYFTFKAQLDDWRDLEVAGVERTSETALAVHLRGDRDEPCVTATLAVRDSALRVEARVDDGELAPRAWSTGFATTEDEAFLGFGERFNATNHRGRTVFSWLEEGGIGAGEGDPAGPDNPFPSGEEMAYYPVPFFVSTRGYGFWLDTTWRSEFALASERGDAWRAWHIGPALAFEVYTPTPADPRPWPYHLVDRFTAATGRPMVPPPWAYGPRRRFGPGAMQGGVPEDRAMRDLDLAITSVDDALHFYPDGSHVGREAGQLAWTARARALGYRVDGYFNSMINVAPDSPLRPQAEEGLARDYFLRSGDGTYPPVFILTGGDLVDLYVVDFTSPEAAAWYASSLDWATDLGYAGWMYDFGEYVQPEVVAANGMTGEELHNLYPVLYARAAYEHLEAGPHAGDWNVFMRSGYTGSSAFVPVVWAGDPAASFEDADGLPSMIRGGINLGIAGAPNWGGDIGGYHCIEDGAEAADGELITRWIQQGALTPIMQDQDACVGGGRKASIWTSPDAMAAWKTYARLHTRLFPYLYALGRDANATGAPILRHVWFEHPDRPDLAGEDAAYYLGPALYVAPVVERGARQKTVRLPAGLYLDWQAQVLVPGGAEVTLDAPLDKLPLLLRAGRLVPLLDPAIDTLSDESDPDIVSMADVDDVYDVVGLLVPDGVESAARYTPFDGGELAATWTGGFEPPALPEAATEDELASCAGGCWRRDELAGGLARVRITVAAGGEVVAGGLAVGSSSPRRIRWDLYLAPAP